MMQFVGILFFASLIGGNFYWNYSRSKSILKDWADAEGYIVLDSEIRIFRRGPFMLSNSRQSVFYVTVRDRTDRVRSGWVRCGGWLVGVWSDEADVRWADELR